MSDTDTPSRFLVSAEWVALRCAQAAAEATLRAEKAEAECERLQNLYELTRQVSSENYAKLVDHEARLEPHAAALADFLQDQYYHHTKNFRELAEKLLCGYWVREREPILAFRSNSHVQ